MMVRGSTLLHRRTRQTSDHEVNKSETRGIRDTNAITSLGVPPKTREAVIADEVLLTTP
jgi:hypothetical protein